jgi:FlaG/FlaF family flagellin (archaellin)
VFCRWSSLGCGAGATKGLEPIVAAVLLIVVAVIGAVLVYLWFAGYVTKATSQAEQMAGSEKLKIEAANLTSTYGYLFIRNLGNDNATLATIYILKPGTVSPLCANSTPIRIHRGTSTATGTVSTLFPGRVHLVRFTVSACGINAGYDYVIKVVTQTKTRGIEPIVAAVLLIVIAVLGAVLIYFWFGGFITRATSQAEQMAASEKLKIEAANLTSTHGYLFIRNLGNDNATIATIFILKPGTVNPLCTNSTAIGIYRGTDTGTGTVPTLYPSRLHLVRFTVSACGIYAGYDYVIKVVTQRGTEFAVTVTAS